MGADRAGRVGCDPRASAGNKRWRTPATPSPPRTPPRQTTAHATSRTRSLIHCSLGHCVFFSYACQLPNPTVDPVDDFIGRRRPGRNAHGGDIGKPLRLDVGLRLYMVNPRAMPLAGVHQLARVVAVGAADDNDQVALTR